MLNVSPRFSRRRVKAAAAVATVVQRLSVPLPRVSPPQMLRVVSRCPPDKLTSCNPAICLPHTGSVSVTAEQGSVGVCNFISGHRPCGHSAAPQLRGENQPPPPHPPCPKCVCVCVFLQGHLRQAAPGRALSRPQEGLWEQVRESFREMCVCVHVFSDVCVCLCGAVRWICVHHGCIWPRGA